MILKYWKVDDESDSLGSYTLTNNNTPMSASKDYSIGWYQEMLINDK